MEKLFFVKLLMVLCLICMILLVGKKINEQFQDVSPPAVRLSVNTNKSNSKLILNWNKTREDISDFYIIYYLNNDGPFIITLPNLDILNTEKDNFSYEHLDVKMNLDYKFAIVASNGRALSRIDKFVKAKLTPPGLQVEYVNDAITKVICNSDGSHTITNSKKCQNEKNLIEAKSIEYEKDGTFNYNSLNHTEHEKLIRNLNHETKIKLNF